MASSPALYQCLEKGLGISNCVALKNQAVEWGGGFSGSPFYCSFSSVVLSYLTVICAQQVLSASRISPLVMNVAFPFNTTLLIAKRLQKVNGLMWTLSHCFYLNFWTLESLMKNITF